MKFLEWFVKDSTQKKWGELGGYTCSKAILESQEFRKATPYNEAFYQSMLMVKDFWATPEYAELLDQLNQRLYPYIVDGKGTAKEALGRRRSRLDYHVQEVQALQSTVIRSASARR